MSTAAQKRRLAFRQVHFEPVLSGSKICTVRFSSAAAKIKAGDPLVLAFGNRMKPQLLNGTVTRAEHPDLEPDVEAAFTLDDTVMSLLAERRFYERTLEPTEQTPPAVLDALAGSGGTYTALVNEAAAHDPNTCSVIWWRLD